MKIKYYWSTAFRCCRLCLFAPMLLLSALCCCCQACLHCHLPLLFFMVAVRFANVGAVTCRLRCRYYLPFALPLLPTVCVAAVTYRLRYRCYQPFALPLLPTVCAAAATDRLRHRCYLPRLHCRCLPFSACCLSSLCPPLPAARELPHFHQLR